MLSRDFPAAIALTLLFSSVAHAQSDALTFLKKIGPGWQSDKAGWMSFVAFSPDGAVLAAATDLGGLDIWDLRNRARLHSVKFDGLDVSTPVFPAGRLVAVGVYGTGTAFVVDVRSGKVIAKAKVSDLGCGSVAFSPDGRYLIAPSTGGLITWPYDRGGTIRVFGVLK